MSEYLNISVPKGGVIVSVKLDDEGVVVDIIDVHGEVIESAWKTYEEFGKRLVIEE
jgi:hypothetical protein